MLKENGRMVVHVPEMDVEDMASLFPSGPGIWTST
jgi:flavin reductase (DIM6/NTAB) family NADH-FMN oxidoreductase RutF